ncbi:hypothetical protein C7H62_2676 [Mesoflavibacter sp. HG96]|uniref:hypothetical protein n=1 Tax=Mesoflavibacter TaxID=444051 RepID=UPI000D0F94BE|nr:MULTISPECIES: hypothetical protein [Mesoflavibacter]QIJ90484.1 hypothetical protein C7H62_2676 [Mesoflavibacter sp. HG96]QIJ93212.1 hypothetical protein C7H56_2676 [Mesoflavibacter sp. HG37]
MKAFVIIPFNPNFDDIYQIGIKETAKSLNVEAYRLDEELFDEGMLDKIYSEIENCDFIIADLSDKNPNVFYELGYAHALGKRCILTTQKADNIPFDLKHKRHIVYEDSIVKLKESLERNIKWIVEELKEENNNPFEISSKTEGDLSKTEDYAKAKIDLYIDIENKSNKMSPEIHAIYLHTKSKWDITQNGKKVTNRKSETNEFNYKYSLTVDRNKIPDNGWIELVLISTKFLANAWEGDEIKDSYLVTGNNLVEIITESGVFSKIIPINIRIDSLAF